SPRGGGSIREPPRASVTSVSRRQATSCQRPKSFSSSGAPACRTSARSSSRRSSKKRRNRAAAHALRGPLRHKCRPVKAARDFLKPGPKVLWLHQFEVHSAHDHLGDQYLGGFRSDAEQTVLRVQGLEHTQPGRDPSG